jgi:hypothetical protein
MTRKQKTRKRERQRYSDAQLQAFRARQEATLSRDELEARREEDLELDVERERDWDRPPERKKRREETPHLTPEQIAAEYAGVRQEVYRIAIIGGFTLVLLLAIAVYMNL